MITVHVSHYGVPNICLRFLFLNYVQIIRNGVISVLNLNLNRNSLLFLLKTIIIND